eukprot:SAG11_NODE_30_length_23132_cov_22.413277_9_plen_103_part_00
MLPADAVASAASAAQIEKLNEMLRISKEDVEQARKEAEEKQGSIEAAYQEGRVAKEALEVLTKQRENERMIVKKAMSELKKMHVCLGHAHCTCFSSLASTPS